MELGLQKILKEFRGYAPSPDRHPQIVPGWLAVFFS
ncbi:MAG: hypothetical protein RJB66_151 [Pseudomonadota bacterium]